MLRDVHRRKVYLTGEISGPCPFDLRVAGWGAAAETLQIDLVAKGWMTLYEGLLEPSPCQELRWQADGPGGSAEIKRAYSALMGRFFGRGVLRVDHGCCWLEQVHDGMELAPGVHLRRKSGDQYKGDLPDWVGVDVLNHCLIVAEAKGSRSTGAWISGTPAVVTSALNQLQRIEIVDPSGTPIYAKTWVVASRWGTTINGKTPVLMTVDPDLDGRGLTEDEFSSITTSTHARWVSTLLSGLGRQDVAAVVRSGGEDQLQQWSDSGLVRYRDFVGYAALVTESAGVLPLVGEGRGGSLEAVRASMEATGGRASLLLLNKGEVEKARERRGSDPAGFLDDFGEKTGAMTIDGLTFAPLVGDAWSEVAPV